jgi:hypothetical protein
MRELDALGRREMERQFWCASPLRFGLDLRVERGARDLAPVAFPLLQQCALGTPISAL